MNASNLANLQLHMNNACCGWIWISNGTEGFLLPAHSHIDKMPSCIKDIVVHFIVTGRHFFGGGYSISPFNILVYLNDERVFSVCWHFLCGAFLLSLCYFVTPFTYYRIELRELLSIEMGAHTTGTRTHCIRFWIYRYTLVLAHTHTPKHIFSVFLWGSFGEILAKPERLNRDDNVTENPNAWKSVYTKHVRCKHTVSDCPFSPPQHIYASYVCVCALLISFHLLYFWLPKSNEYVLSCHRYDRTAWIWNLVFIYLNTLHAPTQCSNEWMNGKGRMRTSLI